MIIGIIPARGGSKGVPKKNIKELAGYPLIAYSIAASKLANKIDRTIVSTDSAEIAKIAKKFGAEVPFLRPANLASDRSPDFDFMKHAIAWLKENENFSPDLIVHLRPTTPLRNPEIIDEAIDELAKNNKATALRSVFEIPESPYKMFHIKDGFLKGLLPNDPRPEYYNLPRQNFKPVYNPNGYVDIVRSEVINSGNSLHGNNMKAFIVPNVGEIDTIEDFNFIDYELNKTPNKVLNYLKENY
jgi:CMP-N,N'-diacetyllegionaminic acid synthase